MSGGRPRKPLPIHLLVADRAAGLSVYRISRLRHISERTLARFFVSWEFCRYGFDTLPLQRSRRHVLDLLREALAIGPT
jgi:hypothetical protein